MAERINIINTEYSFKKCFMHMKDVHKYVRHGMLGVADYDNTFAHIPLSIEADKHKFKALYGVRLRVSRPENAKARTGHLYTTFIAEDNEGLEALNRLVSKAWDQFYYFPRLSVEDVKNRDRGIVNLGEDNHCNYFPNMEDRPVYELLAGRTNRGGEYYCNFENKVGPMHIKPTMLKFIADQCNATPRHASMVKYKGKDTIMVRCLRGAQRRGLVITSGEYGERFRREIKLIEHKKYVDYFMITADMVRYAKSEMLVGPARGSSAGSLICYLLGITEVDPIKHGLIFERFIDVNRFDLPDIDIDFPDAKRHMVVKYLADTYGQEKVRTLANINRLMPKSAIGEFAAGLGIPKWETEDVKASIIERSTGDARAAMCIADTLEGTEPGRAFIEKFPAMNIVSRIEGHAAHAGKHAAGVIVATRPLTHYGSINSRDDVIQMDKKSAEHIGLLKIDCLGLRTLSILEEAALMSGMSPRAIYKLPLDDKPTFEIFNQMRLSGIFQFEGQALKMLTRQLGVYSFEDICAITSLARPGALNSGGAARYTKYKTGVEIPVYRSETHKNITQESLGIVIYQEQMMAMAKEIGGLTWEDVSTLRKAASKSMGDEFFATFKEKFIKGAMENGTSHEDASDLWNDISATGSWTFNKSHAVSYGMISYWTAWFKAHHPLAFATATMNHATDPDIAIRTLRDLVKHEGIEYLPVDPDLSGIKWSNNGNILIGGLTNIDGIGPAKAKQIIRARSGKAKMTPGLYKKLSNPKTPYDILFPAYDKWGDLFENPGSYGMKQPTELGDIDKPGEYVVIGKVIDRDLRDRNDYQSVVKRGGEKVDTNQFFLKLQIEDDTDSIMAMVPPHLFDQLNGKHLAETLKPGETWVAISGELHGSWRMITIKQITNLTELFGEKK